MTVIGPMARTAADLALALDILAGPDGPQATAYRLALPDSRQSELKKFRVLVIDEHPLLPTSRDVRAALDRIVEKIGKVGAKDRSLEPPRSRSRLAGQDLRAATYFGLRHRRA